MLLKLSVRSAGSEFQIVEAAYDKEDGNNICWNKPRIIGA